jgi:transposase
LAERVGVRAAAKQLGLHDSQLLAWRSKARLHQEQGEAERQLVVENARLKRQLAVSGRGTFYIPPVKKK